MRLRTRVCDGVPQNVLLSKGTRANTQTSLNVTQLANAYQEHFQTPSDLFVNQPRHLKTKRHVRLAHRLGMAKGASSPASHHHAVPADGSQACETRCLALVSKIRGRQSLPVGLMGGASLCNTLDTVTQDLRAHHAKLSGVFG